VGIAKAERQARAEGLEIDFRRMDLDGWQIDGQYDLLLNFNFLLRPMIPEEVRALEPGGLLLFDTILESPRLLATHNPDFFLRYGELEGTFQAFGGRYYSAKRSGRRDAHGTAVVQEDGR